MWLSGHVTADIGEQEVCVDDHWLWATTLACVSVMSLWLSMVSARLTAGDEQSVP